MSDEREAGAPLTEDQVVSAFMAGRDDILDGVGDLLLDHISHLFSRINLAALFPDLPPAEIANIRAPRIAHRGYKY